MTAKGLFLETIKPGSHSETLLKQYEALAFCPVNPAYAYVRCDRFPGMPPTKDRFGTTIVWPETQVAAMPHVTAEDKALKDITQWRNEIEIPDIAGMFSDPALWTDAKAVIDNAKASGKLAMSFMPTGVFERLHFLMGFEDTLVNFYLEPDAMMDLCNAIGEYRFQCAKVTVDNLHPDVMLSHDDWGAKTNLFIDPDTWRTFIKPQYEKTYKYLKDNGVIVIHHADSYLAPIVEDMVDLGVDVWQGVLPQNDIPALQKQLGGRMTLMGGIDAAIVDRVDSTEEEIREETRRACSEYAPGGNFIPCITYGAPGCLFKHVDPIINDEIDKYSAEHM